MQNKAEFDHKQTIHINNLLRWRFCIFMYDYGYLIYIVHLSDSVVLNECVIQRLIRMITYSEAIRFRNGMKSDRTVRIDNRTDKANTYHRQQHAHLPK